MNAAHFARSSPIQSRPAEAWDAALHASATPAPLNQSWAWGEVQGAAGWNVKRVWLSRLGPVTVLVQGAGPMRWGYVPRGPAGCSAEMLEVLVAWARSEGLARLRVEPESGPELGPVLSEFAFRRRDDVQPSHTRIIQLGPDDRMLASFRSSTRYNIRYAERKGVVVDEGADAGELAVHVAASAARAGINLPGRDYLQLLLDRLPGSRTFVARHEGESLCALMVAMHDGRGYYLYSGSNGRQKNLKAMDLAMWRGIQYAAGQGCQDYDLWGIPPNDDPGHPWHGFSEFKAGFGGEKVTYAGTWDLVLSPTASLIAAREATVRTVRRLRR